MQRTIDQLIADQWWDIFAGIDGTGPGDDAAYANEFKNSFVNEHSRAWPRQAFAYYQRGPGNLDIDIGNNTQLKSYLAFNFVHTTWRACQNSGRASRIFLAGYSRGGAAVIDVCNRLYRMGIRVDCLMLYDAVDMSTRMTNVQMVPPNVAVCYHAMRSDATRSRPSWGNCGRLGIPNGNLGKFFCTHGGMGGTPWKQGSFTPIGGKILEDIPVQGVENAARYVAAMVLPGSRSAAVATNVTPQQDKSGSDLVRIWARARWNQALYRQSPA